MCASKPSKPAVMTSSPNRFFQSSWPRRRYCTCSELKCCRSLFRIPRAQNQCRRSSRAEKPSDLTSGGPWRRPPIAGSNPSVCAKMRRKAIPLWSDLPRQNLLGQKLKTNSVHDGNLNAQCSCLCCAIATENFYLSISLPLNWLSSVEPARAWIEHSPHTEVISSK